MQVLKFGGTSVANAANISKVIDIATAAAQQETTIVVVSALGGITDALIEAGRLAATGQEDYKERLRHIESRHMEAARELVPVVSQSSVLSLVKKHCNELESICDGVFLLRELSVRTLDRVMSFGELLSSQIVAASLKGRQVAHQWQDSRQLIRTNSQHGFAAVDFAATNQLINDFVAGQPEALYLVPGFIAADEQGITTTLGRGGSDYTAAIFAGALGASRLEIWTDVSGMMTADPRLVPHARPIPRISYQEAMELSHFGPRCSTRPPFSR
ncbi:aspartate kinase [Hymenobacter cellulosilyticus]|uniref:Aspartokinase n=1 Tax=Hymenobacter cellulosilyticus TaxID=2932248 RepID=A0A8T9QEJ5_9BACT|nr:aspartate kinase [Hymenobacter cellulosilyticus]UOQ73253.1 aspartate kinase [Hymenobacter cellulosilyticus]